jgi:hypothetical protein
MDSRSMSYTSPSNRNSSQIYKDLTTCRLPNRRYSNEAIQDLIMDLSSRVSLHFFAPKVMLLISKAS